MSNRIEKFKKKISGDVRKQRYDAQKEQMVKLETAASEDLEKIEIQIKSMAQGYPALHLPYYIIFGKEIYKKQNKFKGQTLLNEVRILLNKWVSRGLSECCLRQISGALLNYLPIRVIPNRIGFWPFCTGKGAVAYDFSGNNYHGDIIGATWTPYGKVGSALSFDGIDDWVNSDDNILVNFGSASYSIGFWFYHKDIHTSNVFTEQPCLFSSRGETSTFPNLYISLRNSLYHFRYQDLNDDVIAITPQIASQWNHLVAIKEGSNLIFYLNGIHKQTSIITNEFEDLFSEDIAIGKGFILSNFKGLIDEVMVFNRVLTPEEILKIYETTR